MFFLTLIFMSLLKFLSSSSMMIMIISLEMCISVIFMFWVSMDCLFNNSMFYVSFFCIFICEGSVGLSILVSMMSVLLKGLPSDVSLKV